MFKRGGTVNTGIMDGFLMAVVERDRQTYKHQLECHGFMFKTCWPWLEKKLILVDLMNLCLPEEKWKNNSMIADYASLFNLQEQASLVQSGQVDNLVDY